MISAIDYFKALGDNSYMKAPRLVQIVFKRIVELSDVSVNHAAPTAYMTPIEGSLPAGYSKDDAIEALRAYYGEYELFRTKWESDHTVETYDNVIMLQQRDTHAKYVARRLAEQDAKNANDYAQAVILGNEATKVI